jgi:hypothetical protein
MWQLLKYSFTQLHQILDCFEAEQDLLRRNLRSWTRLPLSTRVCHAPVSGRQPGLTVARAPNHRRWPSCSLYGSTHGHPSWIIRRR